MYESFGKNAALKDGYQSKCFDCIREYQKRPERIEYEKKINKRTDRQQQRNDYKKEKRKDESYRKVESEKNNARNKSYSKNEETRKHYLETRNNWKKNKWDNDCLFKLKELTRSRLRQFINQKSQKTNDLIGCDNITLKKHIESQFREGMSWSNWKLDGWHLDHKIPLASAKTETELYKLCHYTNLQPLWCTDNLSKGAKVLV